MNPAPPLSSFAAIVLATVAALTASCTRPPAVSPDPEPGRSWIGALEIVEVDVPPTDLMKVERADLAQHIEAIYRLKPDRRFIYAASEVHRLLGGAQERAFLRHLDGGGWTVRLGDLDVGQLPELPTFSEGLAFVRRWAARQWQSTPHDGASNPARDEVGRLESRRWRGSYLEHLQIAERVNALAEAAPHDASLMRLAADDLLAITQESADWMRMHDPVLGRVMALLALSEATAGAEADPTSLCVLAARMGYGTEARGLAAALPADDPWRLLLSRKRRELVAAFKANNEPFLGTLAMATLASRGDEDEVLAIGQEAGFDRDRSIELLTALVGLNSFSLEPAVDVALANEAFRLVVKTRLPSGEDLGPTLGERLRAAANRLRKRPQPPLPVQGRLLEFEDAVRRQADRLAGPLIDHVTLTAVLRAPLYSGLLSEAGYYLDMLSSTPDAAEWATTLVEPPPGAASELKRWVEDRVAIRSGVPGSLDRVAHDMATLRCIGSWAPVRLVTSLNVSAPSWTDPRLRRPVRGLLDGLDSRPKHLASAGVAVGNLLWDHKRWQRYCVAAAERAPESLEGPQLTFVATNLKDTGALWRLAGQENLAVGVRSTALVSIAKASPREVPKVVTSLRALGGDADPGVDRTIALALADVLDGTGEPQAADRAIDEWLKKYSQHADLAYAAMLRTKARRLRERGRLDEAWRAIAPAIPSWKADCLEEAATVLLDLRRSEEALEIAAMLSERYPENEEGCVLDARALWQLGRPRDAAARLQKGLNGRPDGAWSNTVASAFIGEFGGTEASRAKTAFDELAPAGVAERSLLLLGQGIGGKGDHALAFRVLSWLIPSSPQQELTAMLAFDELLAAEGLGPALAWLSTRFPTLPDSSIMQAYRIGADELVWEYPGQPPGAEPSPLRVLLQAVTYARAAHPVPARRQRILDFARRQPANSWTSLLPRYLIGEVDESAILPMIQGTSDICNFAWIIGSRKAGEGKIEEAADWFQVAMETGDQSQPAYSYSYDLMARWSGSKLFLEDIAAQRLLVGYH